jgi:hypothetical protein
MTLLRNNRRVFRKSRSKRANRASHRQNHGAASGESSLEKVTSFDPKTDSQLRITALPAHQYPSRNGSSSHQATMSPLAAEPHLASKSQPRPLSSLEQMRNRIILLLSTAGAGTFGIIVSIGPLIQGGTLFPHRIRALFAVLFVVALWSLCACAAPNLLNPNRPKKRLRRVIVFLVGIVLLMAGLRAAKEAMLYVAGGFPMLLLLNALIVADVHPILKNHRVRHTVVLFFLSALLGALSIAVMHGEWDAGGLILATGYGALCAAVGLTTDNLPPNERLLPLYSALILGGSLSLPALAILAGLPPRYLITYLAIAPAIIHLRRLSRVSKASQDGKIPSPYVPFLLSVWFLFSVATLSFFSSDSPSEKFTNHQQSLNGKQENLKEIPSF